VLKIFIISIFFSINVSNAATFQNKLFGLIAPDDWKIQKEFFGADVMLFAPFIKGKKTSMLYIKSYQKIIKNNKVFEFLMNDLKTNKEYLHLKILSKYLINKKMRVIKYRYLDKNSNREKTALAGLYPLKKQYIIFSFSNFSRYFENDINQVENILKSLNVKGL